MADGSVPGGLPTGIQFAGLDTRGTEAWCFSGGRVGRGGYAAFILTSASLTGGDATGGAAGLEAVAM